MKATLLILGFIIYNMWLFWVEDYWVLAGLMVIDLLYLLCRRRNWRAQGRFLLKNCGFVAFVVLCNLLFSDWQRALLLGARLGLAIEATYIISQILSIQEFAQGIAGLCAPLKLFKVDTDELALSVAVALTFVPLLTREAKQLQNNLKLRGCTWKTLCRQPQVYVVGIVTQLLDYAEAAEQTLRLKGYN